MTAKIDDVELFDLVPAHKMNKYLRRLLIVYIKHDPEACLENEFSEMIRDLECIFDFLDEFVNEPNGD